MPAERADDGGGVCTPCPATISPEVQPVIDRPRQTRDALVTHVTHGRSTDREKPMLNIPDSPEFLRKCRFRLFACGGANPACMDDLVVNLTFQLGVVF